RRRQPLERVRRTHHPEGRVRRRPLPRCTATDRRGRRLQLRPRQLHPHPPRPCPTPRLPPPHGPPPRPQPPPRLVTPPAHRAQRPPRRQRHPPQPASAPPQRNQTKKRLTRRSLANVAPGQGRTPGAPAHPTGRPTPASVRDHLRVQDVIPRIHRPAVQQHLVM